MSSLPSRFLKELPKDIANKIELMIIQHTLYMMKMFHMIILKNLKIKATDLAGKECQNFK